MMGRKPRSAARPPPRLSPAPQNATISTTEQQPKSPSKNGSNALSGFPTAKPRSPRSSPKGAARITLPKRCSSRKTPFAPTRKTPTQNSMSTQTKSSSTLYATTTAKASNTAQPPRRPFIPCIFIPPPRIFKNPPMNGEMGVFFRRKEYNLCITKALPRILCIHNFG